MLLQLLKVITHLLSNLDSIQVVSMGINATIFAYGQTGSGKTHSMFGSNWEDVLRNGMMQSIRYRFYTSFSISPIPQAQGILQTEKHGIIPRTIYKVFHDLSNGNGNQLADYTVTCTFLQIYNEKLYDLLQDQETVHPLLIRESRIGGIYVQGINEFVMSSMDECLMILMKGERNRITRQTRLNMFSSRSHTIFQIRIEHSKVDEKGNMKRAKLNLCDLAGSEKIGTEANITGMHFEELKTINLSLSTLGKVISGLSQNSTHIPYRDSKLTRLLQDSLGGGTRTCLIATVSPIADCADETISTLCFANSAKKVQIKVKANEVNASNDVLVKKLQSELQYLKDLLQLKRKGGMSDIHRQVLLLKQENDKLRAMSQKWQMVEQISLENKMMKLELQKYKENGSTMGDTDTHSNIPPGETLIQAQTIIERENLTRNSQDSKPNSIKSFLTTISASDVTKQIEQSRKVERSQAAQQLRKTMVEIGRCPICTLPLPCKHYKIPSDIVSSTEKDSPILKKTNNFLEQNDEMDQELASFPDISSKPQRTTISKVNIL